VPATTEFDFDVFLSHASEDEDEVRDFARRLEAAGLRGWLDEEQLHGGDPEEAIVRGLEASRHVVIWVTDTWQSRKKAWTRWELEVFAEAERSGERRVVPVLHVPRDVRRLGPFLTREIAVPEDCDPDGC